MNERQPGEKLFPEEVFKQIKTNRQRGLPFDVSVLVAMWRTTIPDPDPEKAREFVNLQALALLSVETLYMARTKDVPVSDEETAELWRMLGLDEDTQRLFGRTPEEQIRQQRSQKTNSNFKTPTSQRAEAYLTHRSNMLKFLEAYDQDGILGIMRKAANEMPNNKGLIDRLMQKLQTIRDEAIKRGIL